MPSGATFLFTKIITNIYVRNFGLAAFTQPVMKQDLDFEETLTSDPSTEQGKAYKRVTFHEHVQEIAAPKSSSEDLDLSTLVIDEEFVMSVLSTLSHASLSERIELYSSYILFHKIV
jgi:hypothetical protein